MGEGVQLLCGRVTQQIIEYDSSEKFECKVLRIIVDRVVYSTKSFLRRTYTSIDKYRGFKLDSHLL